MRESSLVPTNLLNWPQVARRLPEEKLLLMALWSAPWISCAGYGELPLCPFAASIGISPESTETGISNLEQAGLVFSDELTAELALDGWFRFHKFKTPQSRKMLEREIVKIRSSIIKSIVIEKSKACLPTPTSASTSINTTTAKTRRPKKPPIQDAAERRVVLIFPPNTPHIESESIYSVLISSGVDAALWQPILDELTGARSHRTIGNPVGFLRGIAERAVSGTFAPERGIAVAQKRMAEEMRAQEVPATSKRSNEKLLPIEVVLDRRPAATSAFLSRKIGEANLT